MNIVSDLEGTLTTGSTWRAMRAYLKLYREGKGLSRFVLKWMPRFLLVKLGLFSHYRARVEWMDDEIAMLTNPAPEELDRLGEWIVENVMWPNRRPEILDELAAHHRDGARLVIASGTYLPVAQAFARRIDAEAVGTNLAIIDGAPKIIGEHCTGEGKLRKAQELLHGERIDLAYGDTLADLLLLEAATTAVAIHPDTELLKIASARGWRVVREG